MFDSLRSISDTDIISRMKAARAEEHAGLLSLVLHLIEFDRRQLHLKLGYQSVFAYCTGSLGYSESAAMRRITAARCVAKVPEVHGLLESGRVNLSTVSCVSRILTPWNAAVILSRVSGKSLREVEAIAAEYEPESVVPRDRVRTVVVRVPLTLASGRHSNGAPSVQSVGGVPGTVDNAIDHNRNGGKKSSIAVIDHDVTASKIERRAVIQFSAREEFMAKVEHARSLVWHRLPARASLEQVFELALDVLIERNDPAARQKRREQRKSATQRSHVTNSGASKRSVAAPTRDQVFIRDEYQCTYIDAGGRRCGATTALQVDHVKPVARGGASTIDNLRLLCASHNRFEAERLMGAGICRPPSKTN